MGVLCFALSALNVFTYSAGTHQPINLAAAVFCGLCGIANVAMGVKSL